MKTERKDINHKSATTYAWVNHRVHGEEVSQTIKKSGSVVLNVF